MERRDNNQKLYKGKLNVLEKSKDIILERTLAIYNSKNQDMKFLNADNYTPFEIETLRNYLRALVSLDYGTDNENGKLGLRATREDILKILVKLFPKETIYMEMEPRENIEICFTLVRDSYGNFYGKEYHTGLYFPIVTLNNLETEYYLKSSISEDGLLEYVALSKSDLKVKSMDEIGVTIRDIKEITLEEQNKYKNRYRSPIDFITRKKNNNAEKEFIETISSLGKKNKYKNNSLTVYPYDLENIEISKTIEKVAK